MEGAYALGFGIVFIPFMRAMGFQIEVAEFFS
jgi:hypothetical protein